MEREQKEYVLELLTVLLKDLEKCEIPTASDLDKFAVVADKILALRQLGRDAEAAKVLKEAGDLIAGLIVLSGYHTCLVQAQNAIIKEDRELAAIAATKAGDVSDLCFSRPGLSGMGKASLMVNAYLAVLFLLD
jgi:hypothetical protein